jgi:hypothetical protein
MVAATCLAALVGTARAQDAAPAKVGPALNWTRQAGAESCIASVELAARIEARVKKKIFVAAPEAIVAVEGYVAPEPSGGFRATIAMSDGQGVLFGSRELHTDGACTELDDGLVFVIAVTLRPQAGSITGIELPENVATALDALFGAEPTEPDPAAFPSAPASSSKPASAQPRPKPEPAAPQAEPAPAAAPQENVRAFIEALGALQLGLQPNVGFGGGFGLRVRAPSIGSFSVHGALFAKTTRQVNDTTLDEESGTDFTTQMLSIGYCTPALLGRSSFGLEACAAGRFGAVAADTSDFVSENNSKASLFAAVGLGARLAAELNANVVVALAAGPELHLARPVFQYLPNEGPPAEVFKVSTVGGAAELSVAFALF